MRLNVRSKEQEANIEDRRKVVSANLLAGLTYRQMAEALNVSLGTIAEDVRIIIGRWKKEQVAATDEYVQLEIIRLDRALNAIWTKVTEGDRGAIDSMLKIMERRAKYKALDAPTQSRTSTFEVTQEMLENATPEQLDQLKTGTDPMIVFVGAK